jgi:PAS domain S-box-containing protein
MLDEILKNPNLAEYHTAFKTGQIIFLEGDDSQDLYILVSGRVEIFKGDKKIRELTQRGSLFGEVSFFLGGSRSASVKAKHDVQVVRIPKEDISRFLGEFPDAARALTKHLAQWLEETSQILHGLKEFCDQLPDAVISTDKEGKILAWNSAAEKLYGRDWQQMRGMSVDKIYQDPKAYKEFLKAVQSNYSIREKTFKITHPQKGTRFISTSMTVLYDGHHNFQGVLSQGRDVTKVKKLERKYKRIGYWLIPSFLLLGVLTVTLFFGYPYFSKGYQTEVLRKQELRNLLAKDYFLLQSLLSEHLESGNRLKTRMIMKNFFKIHNSTIVPYIGLVVLDKDKRVFDAYSNLPDTDVAGMLGSSYAAIDFTGSETSLHKVLTLYRTDKNHPMGKKGIEIAFELLRGDERLGWLVFQPDMDLLKKIHGVDVEDLRALQFDKP